LRGHIYVVHGDITKCVADAIAYSTSTRAQGEGKLYSSFRALEGFDDAYAALRGQPWRPGDCVALSAAPTRPAIIVTFAAGQGEGLTGDQIDARARALVTNAITCAVAHLRATSPTKRLTILLPGFLIGAGGARGRRQQMARAQIAAADETIGLHPNVDVAFVLFQPADHDVFRDARRAVVPHAFADVDPVPPALVRAVRDRECVVFVGAGMSTGAGMPTWRALVEQLRLDDADAADFLAIAQAYRERHAAHGRPPLRELVAALFGDRPGRVPTLAHYLVASLEASNVITTNYDHLIEDALAAQRIEYHRVVETAHVPATGTRAHVNVVKLHGDAERGDDIVLSTADYDRFFEKRPAFALLLSGLLLNQTFLFLGYSLTDPNFRQIYESIVTMLGASTRRPVVATFGAPQLALAHLDVVAFTGGDEPVRLARWLDRLVDDAVRPRSVLLAETIAAQPTPALAELRTKLLDVAAAIERARRGPIAEDEARVFVQIVRVLFDHGFQARPSNGALLSRLAMSLPTDERDAILREAAAQADSVAGAAFATELLPPR
jgi:hypothetical protein